MKTTLYFFVAIILFCSSCKQEAEESSASYDVADTVAVAADEYVEESKNSSVKMMNFSLKAPSPQSEEPTETKIIKTGNLRFQSDDLKATYIQIQTAVKKYKATIKNDSQTNNDYEFSRTIIVRVPNQHFDSFLDDISKGVNYFDQKDISSQDVTEEFIDVTSRIKTKKTLELRYLELLKKANKITEMLEIEKQLSEIREEIEAKEGRLQYLQNKVSLSTVEITFYKPVAEGRKATVSFGGKIGNAIVAGFNKVSNFFIWLLGNWPIIVTLVALFIILRKRFKRKI